MNISQLPKIVSRGQKRLGQGHGSGRVKTSGRGTKGQKARHNLGPTRYFYSGGSLAFVKSLPFLRGKDRNFSFQTDKVVIPVDALSIFGAKSTVDMNSLIEKKLIKKSEMKNRVKIVGGKPLSVALTVKLQVTKTAREAIEKAGGNVA